MSSKIGLSILILAVILSATVILATSQSTTNKSLANQTASNQSMTSIGVSTKAGIGQYLVDGRGMSLYYFANDTPGSSTCFTTPYNEGGILLQTVPNATTCATVWPAFDASGISASSGLNKSDITTIKRDSTHMQTALRGWPLYLYLGDNAPGDTDGNGALKGEWVLARPFGTVNVANNLKVGAYLTDARGMTLYYYKNDQGHIKNTCTDDCANKWPAFYAGPEDIASSKLSRSDFNHIIKDDNYQQTTFRGWPLYYYSGDKKPGDINGQGIGGVWSVVSLGVQPNILSNP